MLIREAVKNYLADFFCQRGGGEGGGRPFLLMLGATFLGDFLLRGMGVGVTPHFR